MPELSRRPAASQIRLLECLSRACTHRRSPPLGSHLSLTMFSNLHIYRTNSILQARATGVDSSGIEVFVEHHKGHDPTNSD
jgi:hypothetical protein